MGEGGYPGGGERGYPGGVGEGGYPGGWEREATMVGWEGVPGVYALLPMVAILPPGIYPRYTSLGTPAILPLIHSEQAGYPPPSAGTGRQPGL